MNFVDYKFLIEDLEASEKTRNISLGVWKEA